MRRLSTRWALWAFAAALLLKAAMPLLASTSAQAQGKALVEVCTVYGVALVPLDGGDPPPSDPAGGHAADHCVLTALATLAGGDPPATAVVGAAYAPAAPPQAGPPVTRRDASAAWVALRKHGPPATA